MEPSEQAATGSQVLTGHTRASGGTWAGSLSPWDTGLQAQTPAVAPQHGVEWTSLWRPLERDSGPGRERGRAGGPVRGLPASLSPQPLQLCSPQHRNTRWGRQSQVPGHLRRARPCSGWEDSIRTHDHPQTTVRLPDSPHPSPPVWMRPDPLQEGDRPGTQAQTLTHTSCPGRTGATRGVGEGRLPPGQAPGHVGVRLGS